MSAPHVGLRQAVCVETWEPTPKQWDFLLSLQTPEDRGLIQGYRFRADAKRSMVARLMLQSCAANCQGMKFGEAQIKRTKEGRPFVANAERPGFNLNLSHHGDWVFLGSEEQNLVGVDVMTTAPPRGGEDVDMFLRDFEDQLTPKEWQQVRGAGSSDVNLYFAFFIFWALKESFIKAIGMGLGFTLRRVEFVVLPELLKPAGWATGELAAAEGRLQRDAVQMRLDGQRREDWWFELGVLGAARGGVPSHVIAAAQGPFQEATPSLAATLGEAPGALPREAVKEGGADGKWRQVQVLTVESLLSGEAQRAYAERGTTPA